MNGQSIRNKTTYMNDHIASCKYDIAVLCETWLNATDESDQVCVNELLPNGYIIWAMSQQTLPCTPPPRTAEGGLIFFV